MIKWLNNVVSSILFFLVYLIIFYLFSKKVSASVIVLTIVFFALAAFAAVTLFIRNLPIQVWHIALPAGVVFGVFSLIGSRGVKELE